MKGKNDTLKTKTHGGGMPLYIKLLVPMMMLSVVQIIVIICAMLFSEEFSSIKKYAYNVLEEKTENRAGYIQNEMNVKVDTVYQTSVEVNDAVEDILQTQQRDVGDIKTDSELSEEISIQSSKLILDMLRKESVNDAFMLLKTDSDELTGIYIRDNDVLQNDIKDNSDLFLEVGSTEVAHSMGISLDYEWSLDVYPDDADDLSFFYEPVNAYEENGGEVYNMGYWSEMSSISRSARKSIKYSLPLVADDGTVYGVIGIGFLEKTLQEFIPECDFLSGSACYIVATDEDGSETYQPQLHAGSAYTRLVTDDVVFDKKNKLQSDLYSYDSQSDVIGCIEEIEIYSSSSPFKDQSWVMISAADSSQVLSVYNNLIKVFFISAIISLCFCAVFTVILTRRITKPVSSMIKELEKGMNSNETVSFEYSKITEIDKLAQAIKDLQTKITEQSARVSKVIGMTDSGIGIFIYECGSENVFVGKSLVKILEFSKLTSEGDSMIPIKEFESRLNDVNGKNSVFDNKIFNGVPDEDKKYELNTEMFFTHSDITHAKWLKFTLSREHNTVIGIVQDVTKNILELKKIEHERDYDIATGLYNRRAFYRETEKLFLTPEKLGVATFWVIDLDNLKFVNDTYGHEVGDSYIRAASIALKEASGDNVIAARLTGGEFIVFLYGGESKEQLRKKVAQIREKMLSSSCTLADGTGYKVRASGGMAWYPDDSNQYGELIKYADFSMFTIKNSTKGDLAEFDKGAYSSDSILVTGIEEMNRIFDDGDIKYAFQKIVSAKTGEVYGYEALMRPQSEIISSVGEFLRIAKASAKLYKVERITWLGALARFSDLRKRGVVGMKSKLFINSISNCKLSVEEASSLEASYGDMLSNLVMEVLESEQTNKKYAEKKKQTLYKWNGLVALDDFGTGYNSEFALITMNPDIIKIDRSIISGCDKDISKLTIIKNLIGIAKEKKITVLAEGVETYGEMKTVIECGVDLLQGYYIARPMFEPTQTSERVMDEIRGLNGN